MDDKLSLREKLVIRILLLVAHIVADPSIKDEVKSLDLHIRCWS